MLEIFVLWLCAAICLDRDLWQKAFTSSTHRRQNNLSVQTTDTQGPSQVTGQKRPVGSDRVGSGHGSKVQTRFHPWSGTAVISWESAKEILVSPRGNDVVLYQLLKAVDVAIDTLCLFRLFLPSCYSYWNYKHILITMLGIYNTCVYIYTVSQKNPCDYVFDDNLNSKRPIVIIFGTFIT